MSQNPGISAILQRHFENRLRSNGRYSIRAYSRDLGVSPSFLSQLMTDQRGLSLEKARAIAQKLRLVDDDYDFFCAQAMASSARSRSEKTRAQVLVKTALQEQEAKRLMKDQFALIADWHHLAIFQCLFLARYARLCEESPEAEVLARLLRVSRREIEEALERLRRHEIIRLAGGGHYHEPATDMIRVPDQAPSAVIRRFHTQILQKALTAMQRQPVEDRFFNTTTLTIAKSDLPAIRADYQTFFKQLIQRYARKPTATPAPDAVYALSAQLFSLTSEDEE